MKIPIQNIYFLLAYAWNSLQEARSIAVSQEGCRILPDLFARVLVGGVNQLLRRGLDRDYLTEEVNTTCPRGKFDLAATLKYGLLLKNQVRCSVDTLTHDVLHNQIIRATLRHLSRCEGLDRSLRNQLLQLHHTLHEISEIELRLTLFSQVRLHRNNGHYRFLMHLCRLVFDNLLIDEKTGRYHFQDFLRDDRQMAVLFEQFIRNFYRQEQSSFRVGSKSFPWQEVEASDGDIRFLPLMKTDVSLTSFDREVTIDAKYYSELFQGRFGPEKVRSAHLYQLFTYLRNLQVSTTRPAAVEGILLYPTVDRPVDLTYRIHGHPLRVATLNLNTDWQQIHLRLLSLLNSTSIIVPVTMTVDS